MSFLTNTKFMGSCSFINFFDTIEEAVRYVEDEIEHMECFYKSINAKQHFKFQVLKKPILSAETGYIIQVMMPEQLIHKTKANLFCIYRIEKIPEDQESQNARSE